MNYEEIEKQVILAKENNDNAIINILEAFKPYIITLIKNTKVNGYTREDLVQELNIKILECINKYNGENTFVGYCTRALKNRIYNLYKNNKKHDNLELQDNNFKNENFEFDNYKIENLLFSNLSLNDIEKNIMILYYINRHTLKEISVILGIPYFKVISLKKLALKKLKYEFSN